MKSLGGKHGKYRDIFSSKFFDYFKKDFRYEIAELELNGSYNINVVEIIELLNLKVKGVMIDVHSGELGKYTIYVNVTEKKDNSIWTQGKRKKKYFSSKYI